MEQKVVETRTYKHLLTVGLKGGHEFDLPYQIVANGEIWFANRIEADNKHVTAYIGESTISDVIDVQGPLIRITRRWALKGDFRANLIFAVFRNIKVESWYVPGVVYAGGESLNKLASSRGPIGEALCTVPGCAAVKGEGFSLAVLTQPAESTGELSSITTHISSSHVELSISVPGDNTYIKSGLGKWFPGTRAAAWIVDGQLTYERRFYVMAGAGNRILEEVMDAAWEILVFQPEMNFEWMPVIQSDTTHLAKDFFIEKNDAVGFVEKIGLLGFATGPVLRGGAIGGNIETARALYRVGRMTENRQLQRIALDTVDFFLAGNDEGKNLCLDYNPVLRRWYSPKGKEDLMRATGVLLADSARMHRTAAPVDYNPRWLFAAKRIAGDLFEKWRNSINNKSGDTAEDSSGKAKRGASLPEYSGASLITAFVELYKETGEKRYLEAGEWLGGPLVSLLAKATIQTSKSLSPLSRDDAHAFLRAFVLLYQETSRTEYLDAAVHTAFFLRTMIYTYRVPMPPGSRLEEEKFNTSGALPPFPGAGWLDPYPAAIAFDTLRLWKLTGDDLWKSTALLMLEFSFKLASRESGGDAGKKNRILRTEKFFHCMQHGSPYKWGSTSGDACWVPALTLGAILDINEHFPEILRLDFEGMKFESPVPSGFSRAFRHFGTYINFFS